jgi:hypothetical protein
MTASLFDRVAAYLRSSGLPVTEHPDEGWLLTNGFGEHGTWSLVGQVDEDDRTVAMYSIMSEPVPVEQRPGMAQLLCRINFGLTLATFELDLDDGQLRLRTALLAEAVAPSASQLKMLVGINLTTMDEYLPAIEAVLEGDDPAQVWAGLLDA